MSDPAPTGEPGGTAVAQPEAGPSGRRRGRIARFDVASVFTVLIVLLFVIPAQLVVGPLGAAGTPAKILGALILIWWMVEQAAHVTTNLLDTPVRRLLFVWVLAILISYIAAMTRPIAGAEMRSADRVLISMLSWVGVVLFAGELSGDSERLNVLLRRVVMLGGALAVFGIFQFFTKQGWTDLIQIPGLKVNADAATVVDRGNFARPAGTATHPIEFGVVLTMLLPLALHYALEDRGRHWLRRAFPVIVIGMVVPLSVSRSAVLSTVVALGIMIPTWSLDRRRMAYLAIGVGLAGVYLTIPGLLGTFRNLISGAGTDSSVASRTDSFALAFSLIERSPVFGRGLGTFIPAYRILDDQLLGTLIECGVVGLLALLALFGGSALTARHVYRRSADPITRSLVTALAASLCAGAASFATFDAFSFPMLATLVFLILGCLDAVWRVQAAGGPPGDPPGGPARAGGSPDRVNGSPGA